MLASGRSRTVLALGASAAVHLAAGAFLLRSLRLTGAQGPPVPRPLEVSLVDRAPEPVPAAEAPGPDRPTPASPPDRRSAAGGPGPRRAPVAHPPPPVRLPSLRPDGDPGPPSQDHPPGGALQAAPGRPEPGSREWLEAEGLSPDEAIRTTRRPGPLRAGAETSDGEGGGRDAGHSAGTDEDRAAAVKARIDGWLADTQARFRATELSDAYWSGLRERLEGRFAVSWRVLEEGPADDRVVSGGRLGEALVAWQREAERWARTGAEPVPGAAPGDPGRRAELFLTEIVSRVEVEQAPDGAIEASHLVGPSGNPAHDALVLAQVGALSEELRVLGGPPAPGRRTRWAVRTAFRMMPPVPVIGCGFDAQFRPAGCFYPLKRTVTTSVRLERVWVR